MESPWRPTSDQIQAARGAQVPDVLAPGLKVLFVGINPGLYSGAVAHHFARPGNRFWKALSGAGFIDRLLSPFEDDALPSYGIGITNLVDRATRSADELGAEELHRGALQLSRKVRRFQPGAVAILGVGAYRLAFDHPRATVGPQEEGIDGVPTWVLPNPSGRTAAYQLPRLVEEFARLRRSVDV